MNETPEDTFSYAQSFHPHSIHMTDQQRVVITNKLIAFRVPEIEHNQFHDSCRSHRHRLSRCSSFLRRGHYSDCDSPDKTEAVSSHTEHPQRAPGPGTNQVPVPSVFPQEGPAKWAQRQNETPIESNDHHHLFQKSLPGFRRTYAQESSLHPTPGHLLWWLWSIPHNNDYRARPTGQWEQAITLRR